MVGREVFSVDGFEEKEKKCVYFCNVKNETYRKEQI